jgi:hypothetical protein
MTKKQYSKPELIEVGNAIKATLGIFGRYRDLFGARTFIRP